LRLGVAQFLLARHRRGKSDFPDVYLTFILMIEPTVSVRHDAATQGGQPDSLLAELSGVGASRPFDDQ
jgi:hypothetical protein